MAVVEVKCPGCKETVLLSDKDIDQAIVNIVAFHYANEVLEKNKTWQP